MNDSVYTFASFSRGESLGFRLGGPGLGNLLFPWARSVAFARKYQLPRINSTWKTVKIGPMLRGEFDKRTYNDLFQEHEIGGIKKFFLLNFAEKIEEKEVQNSLQNSDKRPQVVWFHGMEGLFEPIVDDFDVVKEELYKMVTEAHKKAADTFQADGISVHIRMGDFQEAPSEEILRSGAWNYRLPQKWYKAVIEKIRKAAGKELPVYIFSDGKDQELSELLSLANTQRVFFGSAIADMLALSKSPLLIASASTFSMWASYLGRMPVIWYPTLHRQKLYQDSETFEGELDYEDSINEILINNIRQIV